VFGAGGGLGGAFVEALAADGRCAVVHAGARREVAGTAAKVRPFRFDLADEGSIAASLGRCAAEGPLHLVIVATGLLHGPGLQPERTWRTLTPEGLQQAFAINAIGPALIAKHALERLSTTDKAVFAALSARVGSIADNRLGGWHAYRASKAALNMIIRTCAIELARRNPGALCLALHPGTCDTGLSRPFQSAVAPGKLFTPAAGAHALLEVIDRATPAQTGALLAWDGTPIPY
jgi:NAD(P)-dependent dehydrogenase (short-subunit alcohol dehydrogenase family)